MDRSLILGLSISCAFHIGAFVIGTSIITSPIKYAVQDGAISVEIVASESATDSNDEQQEVIIENKKDDFVIPVRHEPAPKPKKKISKINNTNTEGDSESVTKNDNAKGAFINALPDYVSNPAPVYPEAARRLRKEGMVLLRVTVNSSGAPDGIELVQSSGSDLLDHAALDAVSSWKFKPASIAGISVSSAVEIPIRFKLD